MNVTEWKDVPGYNGVYQANFSGEIRRVYKRSTKILSQYTKTNRSNRICKMNYKETTVSQVIWITFKGPIPKGMNVVHKNGMKSDNCINNLELLSKHQIGIRFGPTSKRKSVAKINSDGEIIEFYTSARECAKQNYLSKQTVTDRCNGKYKSAFAPDGYAYAWADEEVSVRNAIRKIEKENGYMPKARNVVFDF